MSICLNFLYLFYDESRYLDLTPLYGAVNHRRKIIVIVERIIAQYSQSIYLGSWNWIRFGNGFGSGIYTFV